MQSGQNTPEILMHKIYWKAASAWAVREPAVGDRGSQEWAYNPLMQSGGITIRAHEMAHHVLITTLLEIKHWTA